jgi:predicted DNA-binding protein YlxM (UPF0122 family)
MEKLMKPVEYAQELGISRQAVYAKIKRGILRAKNVEGKLYIVVDKTDNNNKEKTEKETKVTPNNSTSQDKENTKDYKALLEAKDETISVLKGTVKDLKKSNKEISRTLRGEIDLLKEAFHEMRTLYIHQLEQKKSQNIIDVYASEKENTSSWIGLKKFFKQHKITKEKMQGKIIKRLKRALKQGDERVMKRDDKLRLDASKEYKDILS